MQIYDQWITIQPFPVLGKSVERVYEFMSIWPHHNFVVITPMIIKFGTGNKFDVFYTMITRNFVTSILLRNYDVITCILADT